MNYFEEVLNQQEFLRVHRSVILRLDTILRIEPYEKTFRVRFRIDGVLYEIMRPPMKLRNALISRLKVVSISESVVLFLNSC